MTSLRNFWARHRAKAMRSLQRFDREEHGASAVEFAFLAVPFLALVFAILELALLFFTASVLSHAVSDTGRLLRVGSLQGCNDGVDFKALVCDTMNELMGCSKNLRIDVETSNNFQTVTFEDAEAPDTTDPDAETPPGVWKDTSAGSPVVIRATFYYPLMLPGQVTRLENEEGTGRHVLRATTAFRNEPFPTRTTCDPAVQSRLNDI